MVDLERQQPITDDRIISRAGSTPHHGVTVTVTGWLVGAAVRGRKVMWDGELIAPGVGERVRFLETLASEPQLS